MLLGDKIKELRKLKSLTQEDLANKSGISRVSIGNYERNDRVPDATILIKIARGLKVQINDFFDIDELKAVDEAYNYGQFGDTMTDTEEIQRGEALFHDLKGAVAKKLENEVNETIEKGRLSGKIVTINNADDIYKINLSHDELLSIQIMEYFNKLNISGKEEAFKRVCELSQLKQYQSVSSNNNI